MAVTQGIERAVEQATAGHFLNSPGHGRFLVHQLAGVMRALDASKVDDPLLYACQCLDHLPQIAGTIIELEKWCVAVNEATPDQITESGVQLCP